MLGNLCTHPTPPLNQADDPIANIPQLFEPIERPAAALPVFEYPRFVRDLPLSEPTVLYFLCSLLRATYAADATYFNSVARAVMPGTYPVTYTAATSGLTPGWAVLKMPRGTIVSIAGTTNRAQWLAQIFSTSTVPTNYLVGGTDAGQTMGIVKSSADAIFTALGALGLADDPYLFIGHSLGGAIAQLLHYRFSIQTQNPTLSRCLAVSSPKPGNLAVCDGMRQTPQVFKRLSLEGDWVPMLPPSLGPAALLVPAPFLPLASNWASYQHTRSPFYVGTDGSIRQGGEPWFPAEVGIALVRAAAAQVNNPAAVHLLPEMVRRIRAAWAGALPDAPTRNWVNPPQIDVANVAMTTAGL